jgi:ATP-binding cassette subfamily C (CFTR/MRP) protein 10
MSAYDWQLLCGRGEASFPIWNSTTGDFGKCFERLTFSCFPHALLAAGSAYHFARHQSRRVTGPVFRSPTLHLRLASAVTALLLCIGALLTSFLYVTLHSGLVDAVDYGFRAVAWLTHAGFIWRLHRLRHLTLRGPRFAVWSFVLTVVSSAVLLQSVIRRQVRESRHVPTIDEWFLYGFCLIYVLYLLTLIPHRHPPAVPRLLHAQEDDEGADVYRSSLRSSDVVRPLDNVDGAGLLSKLVFAWVGPMMTRGAEGRISSVDDLFDLPARLCTELIDDKFHHSLRSSEKAAGVLSSSGRNSCGVTGNSPSSTNGATIRRREAPPRTSLHVSLLSAMRHVLGFQYFFSGVLKLVSDALSFAGPILLNLLLNFMTDPSQPMWRGYVYTGALVLSTLLAALFSTHFNYLVSVVGLKLRAAAISAVYRKTLVISTGDFSAGNASDQSKFGGTGEVVNLMSTDVDRVVNFCPSFHQFWSLPIQVCQLLYVTFIFTLQG